MWILTIVGIAVSLFCRFSSHASPDRYWEGFAECGITIAALVTGKFLIEKLKLQFVDLMAVLLGGYVCLNVYKRPAPVEPPARRVIRDTIGNVKTFTENGPELNGTEVTCDIPDAFQQKNVAGRDGSGLCVFTSIEYNARYQNEKRLWDLQKQMRQEPGGGYPEKVDAMIKKYAPGTPYLQYQGNDPTFLEEVLKTGRPVAVTYNGRDTRYRQTIAHMVTLVYLDAECACILDNNFPTKYYWMTRSQFLERWVGGHQGWAVALLFPPPPPLPSNVASDAPLYDLPGVFQ